MKQYILFLIFVVSLCFYACNNNESSLTNNNNDSSTPATSEPVVAEPNDNQTTTEDNGYSSNSQHKTDEELIFEGANILLNTTKDLIEQQRIKDSINRANREKMYAFQIGLKYREKDALKAYQELADANVSSLYVFKAARKEYYIVCFEAKGEEELKRDYGNFITSLGDNGTEGVKIVNLMEFCSKKETVSRYDVDEKENEIKCLTCN